MKSHAFYSRRSKVRGFMTYLRRRKFKLLLLLLCLTLSHLAWEGMAQQPTVYEYFSSGGITEGLKADQRDHFTLNGKPLTIYSGSFHYFRIHPDQWRDRLRKYRAAGLNAVDIYVPWNLHEPKRGEFDFGQGNNDFSMFLDLPRVLEIVQEEDLLVVFRPGPYICGEWEFGGLPSWLLSETPMFIRTSHKPYQDRAAIYLHEIISRVKDMQFYSASGKTGGPIIAVQIENEYGNFGYGDFPRDIEHLRFLKKTLETEGVESLLFTSDSPNLTKDYGNVDNVLMTANFKFDSLENLDNLLSFQPNRPVFVTEFWPGWFDHWFEQVHNTLNLEDFTEILQNIFLYKGSVNFYMFHGGTNWGFMNGANVLAGTGLPIFPSYAPDTASYDYDAPLTEAGHYTPKYDRAAEMIATNDPLANVLAKPARPAIVPPVAYPDITITEYLDYAGILSNLPSTAKQSSKVLLPMEQLDLNDGNGQSYGYIIYRKQLALKTGDKIKIRGHVRDLLQLIVNGKMVNRPILEFSDLAFFGSWGPLDSEFEVDLSEVGTCNPSCTVDFMVENLGRANYGKPHELQQNKGLWEGPVLLNNQPLEDWEIMSLEFNSAWVSSLSGWKPLGAEDLTLGPKIFKANLQVDDDSPQDTYFDFDCPDCQSWKHGSFFVNGFNVGRYFQVGPQKTLYIPGPFLATGSNEIVIMENYGGSNKMKFTDVPNYGSPSSPQK
ncbi:beta-galactosidase-1-like protein 2 isoform X1 [Tigriopus californicus]|uniref:beta-galactosidase-1-like protein 2 isoform X1 n=1 Tax=Tigriopus californicus TaxID=6832 RepID=UPI0027D9E6ED|nr:beta-galactosidase-1-like protein 2 isoform X1 [Tigriopus californicus]